MVNAIHFWQAFVSKRNSLSKQLHLPPQPRSWQTILELRSRTIPATICSCARGRKLISQLFWGKVVVSQWALFLWNCPVLFTFTTFQTSLKTEQEVMKDMFSFSLLLGTAWQPFLFEFEHEKTPWVYLLLQSTRNLVWRCTSVCSRVMLSMKATKLKI